MGSKFKLGLVQMAVNENKNKSLKKASENIDYLAGKGANIVVLPEMFNCPYDPAMFPIYAEETGDISYETMRSAAKRNGIYLVAGSVPEREGDRIYNTAYIFDPLGNCIGKHRKVHLFDIDVKNGQYFKESETLSAGHEITVVDTIYGKIGVAVCYDIRFPELANLMVKQGAKILIYPASFNMTTGPKHWEFLFRARAIDQQAFVIGCAPARQYDASYISFANSIIVNPWGEVIGRLSDEEGYLLGEIDLEEADSIREQIPVVSQKRVDVYNLQYLGGDQK